jgi:hypothetical protein
MARCGVIFLALGVSAHMCLAAHAESTSEALKAFGLIGTWSQDCAGEDRSVERVTYEVPFFGSPTIAVATKLPGMGIHRKEGNIVSATRITVDKFRLTIDASKTTREDKTWNLKGKSRETALFLRIGDKIKILNLESIDHDLKRSYEIIKDEEIRTKAPNSTVLGFNYSGLTKVPVIYEKCLN